MTKLLYSQSTHSTYSYPRNDDQPVVGLDPDYLVLNKLDTPPPPYDPETETITNTYIVDVAALEYRQEWSVTPLPPKADWDGFNAYMLSDATFKTYRDKVRALDGDLNAALFNAYSMIVTTGTEPVELTPNVKPFALVWGVWSSLSEITTEDKAAIATMAEEYNLPNEFVEIVRGGEAQ